MNHLNTVFMDAIFISRPSEYSNIDFIKIKLHYMYLAFKKCEKIMKKLFLSQFPSEH